MRPNFFKYHSLLNDLVILDRFHENPLSVASEIQSDEWKDTVVRICNRHGGVGADGLLILTKRQKSQLPEMLIFNADGSQAENCINGLRCIALHLKENHGFPSSFMVKIGSFIAECSFEEILTPGESPLITTKIGTGVYGGEREVLSEEQTFLGHIVSVGNPHFIICNPPPPHWQLHGKNIEGNDQFQNRTNVEFVWQDSHHKLTGIPEYHVVVYERGSGETLSCSSGAAAITYLLVHQKKLSPHQKIMISMPGGSQYGWVDDHHHVFLQGKAVFVFSGCLPYTI